LLSQQQDRLKLAIKAADDFKHGASQRALAPPLPQATEAELTERLQQEEAKLSDLEKQMTVGKEELAELRKKLAEKKGQPAPAPKEVEAAAMAPDPEAEKWMEENLGGIRKTIQAQTERLRNIIAEAEKCEEGVSDVARLRTKLASVKRKIPFTQIALEDIQKKVAQQRELLSKA
jgi:septal ring factor EnvC (AmiA/AmiB activator)